ncbi:MAG: MarR family winged helix-turn-helix transcriptional regulator [Desulfomonilaceae bacterium]
MNREPKNLSEQIRRVINRLIFLEKRTVLRHGRLKLHPSEIHLMQVISEYPDLSAGEMAQKLGISNGAVSQTLERLERKGVITKFKDPTLKNRISAAFTALGKDAMERFQAERASYGEFFSKYLTGLSEKERELVGGFLSQIEALLKGLD